MVQGTGSSVGKSVICTALCRVFARDGYRVYPFKSQNMALNSYVTCEGGEMGRAQVAQAEACGVEPHVNMNPILLKPNSDTCSQVIVSGRVLGNFTAGEYYELKPRLRRVVRRAYSEVLSAADIVVIEGAGSPAEINLNDGDFVNMGMARIARAPVILVGDIDRGGVFASLVGTMALLSPRDRERVRGVIINKFRGDIHILEPGLRKLERLMRVPVLGVLPYTDVLVDDEDSATEAFLRRGAARDVRVGVVFLPHMSNFTDFTPLQREPDVSLEYIGSPSSFGRPDLVVIPGSKNTMGDLSYLREAGLDRSILRYHGEGGVVFGICGGFQMLGRRIADPFGVEGPVEAAEGLGLLPVETVMRRGKRTTRTVARILPNKSPLMSNCTGLEVTGYEIHMGQTSYPSDAGHLCRVVRGASPSEEGFDGWVSEDGRVIGTYLHGIFENDRFVRVMLDSLRALKGLEPLRVSAGDYAAYKSRIYDDLAERFRRHVDVERIYGIIFGSHGT
ncbi:MAG: cobyric acid synthase [Firmicutes bacterium]|jgi:adenosylcobyric acid synthase|nr:cobyric acid synthase [Bacillota bacterium]